MPLGKVVGLGPGHIVLDGDPVGTQSPTAAPPHFRPMPIVAKWSRISATDELLYKWSPNDCKWRVAGAQDIFCAHLKCLSFRKPL